jgi:hypothetical protein
MLCDNKMMMFRREIIDGRHRPRYYTTALSNRDHKSKIPPMRNANPIHIAGCRKRSLRVAQHQRPHDAIPVRGPAVPQPFLRAGLERARRARVRRGGGERRAQTVKRPIRIRKAGEQRLQVRVRETVRARTAICVEGMGQRTSSCDASCSALRNTRPFTPSFTSSLRL